MKININKKENKNLLRNEINIDIEYLENTTEIHQLEEYIRNFEKNKNTIFAAIDNEYIPIQKDEIITFYSDKKYNYCKTKETSYRIKHKLYEIEKMDKDYIRISKCCIMNLQHIKCFDLSTTGSIVAKFDDGTEERVSRRKAKEVLDYLSKRRI